MKTLKQAKEDSNIAHFLLKCSYCGCKLVVSTKDLTFNDKYNEYQYKCCNCGHINSIDSVELIVGDYDCDISGNKIKIDKPNC